MPTLGSAIETARGVLWLSAMVCGLACFTRPVAAADQPSLESLGAGYPSQIRPLLARYCEECHSADNSEADVNLAEFPTWADVRKHPRTWQKVGTMLDSGQMPPKDADQPTPEERTLLQQWVRQYLTLEAQARAGDPGKVVLRRLSNSEYTYTLRDLTGVDTLDPAREFPVDGAAGEGFTNTGNALVMSPALVTKYLDAAKEVAAHAVLTPEGIHFSPYTSRRDWTDETVAKIREFYKQFSDPKGGGEKVNLQGLVFDTNEGGRLPLEKYFAASITEREALTTGKTTIAEVAHDHGLSPKYLGILWSALNDKQPSLLLDPIRAHWRAAKPEDASALTGEVGAWQKALWRFATVGHIGKLKGPKSWLEPVDPLSTSQEIRFKIPPAVAGSDITLTLVTSDAGDGNEHDIALWQQPRLVAAGRPDILLRDVRGLMQHLAEQRRVMFTNTAQCLAAAAEATANDGSADVDALAKKHGLAAESVHAWLEFLGIGTGSKVNLSSRFKDQLTNLSGYAFISGWGTAETPQLVANSSDQHVRIPGNMKPHGVAVHPSVALRAAVGWSCPQAATVRIAGVVTHAHPECGNGVTWSLELRRGKTRQQLAAGVSHGGTPVPFGPIEKLVVHAGDLVSLLIGPRDGNHSCDLTAIDLKISTEGDKPLVWDLAADVSPNVLAGNPHADSLGNPGVWHFYTEPEKDGAKADSVIPAGSLLAQWQAAEGAQKEHLAVEVQKLLVGETVAAKDSPDAALYHQLTAIGGPFLGRKTAESAGDKKPAGAAPSGEEWGLDPALFGKHPDGTAVDLASLCVQAPSTLTFRLPADLAAGCELVTTGQLDPRTGTAGSVQLEVVAGKPAHAVGLTPSTVSTTVGNGTWSSDNRNTAYGVPVTVSEGSAARKRFLADYEQFRQLFPAVLCYTKIVPVDEVVTLTLFYREDNHLSRLMLDDAQKAQLDRLWGELHYSSQDALTLVDAFAQLMEYATQDADPKVFEPMRGPINERAAEFRQLLVDSQPKHLEALTKLAAQVLRRPLTDAEATELGDLYGKLREQEIPHDDAVRLLLARLLVSPAFLYRVEIPGPAAAQSPVSGLELANRLSYFLWSSLPDAELEQVALSGQLQNPDVLVAQTRRMLHNDRTRRLATEFACQWLHIRDFDHLDEKSDRHFPTFVALRGAMYEESIQFFTDLFQNNGSVLGILDADHTFLNEELAKHYEIPGVAGETWRRVDNVKQYGRGGILAQATTLSAQSGASRTSPILRGNWVSEVLLGERLPRPPKDVPQLPADEAELNGLTVRQIVEQHSTDPKCMVCHQRIDAMGFSLESYDAIGRRREKDLGDRPINTAVKTMDGSEFDGLDGLRGYLLTVRRDAFLRQFCKKLLGYALGREVQLSDEPLLAEMQTELKAKEFKVDVAIELIVRSRQFREIRGRLAALDD